MDPRTQEQRLCSQLLGRAPMPRKTRPHRGIPHRPVAVDLSTRGRPALYDPKPQQTRSHPGRGRLPLPPGQGEQNSRPLTLNYASHNIIILPFKIYLLSHSFNFSRCPCLPRRISGGRDSGENLGARFLSVGFGLAGKAAAAFF